MEVSRETTMPEWSAERFHLQDEEGSYDMLRLVCPRSGCSGVTWVPASWAVPQAGTVNTRGCPHCSRFAWLPGCVGHPPGHSEEPKRKPRVVRRRKRH